MPDELAYFTSIKPEQMSWECRARISAYFMIYRPHDRVRQFYPDVTGRGRHWEVTTKNGRSLSFNLHGEKVIWNVLAMGYSPDPYHQVEMTYDRR